MVDWGSIAQALPQQTLNGVVLGAVIALAAVALTLPYGILKLANFAHGDYLTFGAFCAFFLLQFAGPTLGSKAAFAVAAALLAWVIADAALLKRLRRPERVLLALGAVILLGSGARLASRPADAVIDATDLLTVAACVIVFVALFAMGMDRVLWRPLRRRGATIVSLMIASIGVALVLRNSIQIYFGGGLKVVNRPNRVDPTILGLAISPDQGIALGVSAIAIVGVHLFLKRTRTGKAMRALGDNPELARVTGINVERTTMHMWALSGALTGLAGVLLAFAVRRSTLYVDMGWDLLLPLFAAVILGGIGSAYGAMLGAFVVGIAMKTSGLWLGVEYDVAAAFILLILVLVVRPQGIFGGRIR